jgi:hypothetical protein
MPAIFDLLYREYCRARLAEMRKQLLIQPTSHGLPEANCDARQTGGPADRDSGAGDGAAVTQDDTEYDTPN